MKVKVRTDRDGAEPVANVKLAYRDVVRGGDGASSGDLALLVKSDGSGQGDLDPFVAARVERSRTAETLTEANQLFELGHASEAKAKLDRRADGWEVTRHRAVALATSSPFAAPPPGNRGLDGDFEDQLSAVNQAESTFGAAAASAAPRAIAQGKAASGGLAQPAAPSPSRASSAPEPSRRQRDGIIRRASPFAARTRASEWPRSGRIIRE